MECRSRLRLLHVPASKARRPSATVTTLADQPISLLTHVHEQLARFGSSGAQRLRGLGPCGACRADRGQAGTHAAGRNADTRPAVRDTW